MQQKRAFWILAGTVALALVAGAVWASSGTVGDTAPTFTLKSVDGKTVSLSDFKGKTVVLEWMNPNCPFSARHAREKTMEDLATQHGEVVWLGINSTNAKSGDFETPDQYKAYNAKNGITYPVLYDETGATGHAYDAKTTPHMFIIDATGKVVYNGAIDDDPSGRKEKTARLNYVGKGLSAEESGATPNPATTKPYGCTVKY
jgi:peroxiredoxin